MYDSWLGSRDPLHTRFSDEEDEDEEKEELGILVVGSRMDWV